LSTIITKTGEQKTKRTVTLTDDSGYSLMATLWGEAAALPEVVVGSIIAVKGAKVSEYGGKSVNISSEHAKIVFNPKEE
jgi:replication factor A1